MRFRSIAIVLIAILALGLLAAPLAAEAQRAGKVSRIGYMSVASRQSAEHLIQIFLRTLRERGWVEGQNLFIEWRWAEGKAARFPDFSAELVRLNVDLIVAVQTDAARAAKNATKTIPIVTIFAAHPVRRGLVASFARPGGNVTGLTFTPSLEIFGKQLQLLKETVPEAFRVAVLWNEARAVVHAPVLREVERAARSLDLELQIVGIRGPEDFDQAFKTITQRQADALLVLADAMMWLNRQRLADLEAKHRLPTMYGLRAHVELGGLIGYTVDLAESMRRAAIYVDKILKGANPAELPVEQPTWFELVINLRTAKTLGLTIPPSVLIRADKVIE